MRRYHSTDLLSKALELILQSFDGLDRVEVPKAWIVYKHLRLSAYFPARRVKTPGIRTFEHSSTSAITLRTVSLSEINALLSLGSREGIQPLRP